MDLEKMTDEQLENLLQNPTSQDFNNESQTPSEQNEEEQQEEEIKDEVVLEKEQEKDSDDSETKKEAPKSIQKLLQQRNEARTQAETMKAEIAEKDRLIQELRNKSSDEISSEERDDQLLDLKMEKKLLENNIKFESQRQQDNRNSQINTFIDSHPEISTYKNDFKTACENYPDLSPRQVYAVLVDEMWIQTQSSKPNYWIAWGSKTSNWLPTDVSKMTDAQLELWVSNYFNTWGIL